MKLGKERNPSLSVVGILCSILKPLNLILWDVLPACTPPLTHFPLSSPLYHAHVFLFQGIARG